MGNDIQGEAFADLPELSEVNRDFKSYVELWEKKYGGAQQASDYVMEWYEETLADKDSTYIETFSDGELTQGKMFKFRYDPKTKDRLAYWDRSPLVISLGKSPSGLELGVNLNFLPKEVKYWMVGEIFRYYEGDIIASAAGKQWRRAYEQKQVPITYDLIAKNLKEWGLDFALRQYYMGQMFELSVVCYEEWIRMVMVNWDDYDQVDESQLIKLYQDYLVRAKSKK